VPNAIRIARSEFRICYPSYVCPFRPTRKLLARRRDARGQIAARQVDARPGARAKIE
jgi:hypothetical protein